MEGIGLACAIYYGIGSEGLALAVTKSFDISSHGQGIPCEVF